MWVVCWVEDGQDHWTILRNREQVEGLLEEVGEDPDMMIFPPEAYDLWIPGDAFYDYEG